MGDRLSGSSPSLTVTASTARSPVKETSAPPPDDTMKAATSADAYMEASAHASSFTSDGEVCRAVVKRAESNGPPAADAAPVAAAAVTADLAARALCRGGLRRATAQQQQQREGQQRETRATAAECVGTSDTKPALRSPAIADDTVVAPAQLECLAAVAYQLGSPLQRGPPSSQSGVQPALSVASELLRRGVEPERVIELIRARSDM